MKTKNEELQLVESFYDKVSNLRQEMICAIINILKEHNNELKLSADLNDLCYVIWFDDNGNMYDSPVKKVFFDKDGICLYVEDEQTGFTSTLYHYDFACQNLSYLCLIYDNLIHTI